MADSGGPEPKRAKTNDIYTTFLTNQRKKLMLEGATGALKFGLYHCKFRTCEITTTNITSPLSFAHAYFKASSKRPDWDQHFKFGDVFSKGISTLEEYVKSNSSSVKLPEDRQRREALEKLLQYLLVIEEESKVLKTAAQSARDWMWTLVFAQHVFSKLVVLPNYVYDDATYDICKGCPCEDHDELVGQRGDTSFGWEDGWHGRTGILMGDVPVHGEGPTLARASSPSSLASTSSLNTETESVIDIEEKTKESISRSELRQIFAETISFSFLKNKDTHDVTLIPTIAVDKEYVTVHMYDSEMDVFLQGGNIELFPEKNLSAVAVVAIWLALNNKLFCSGVIDRMNKSGLHKQIDIDRFKKEVKAPCKEISPEEDDWLFDDEWLEI